MSTNAKSVPSKALKRTLGIADFRVLIRDLKSPIANRKSKIIASVFRFLSSVSALCMPGMGAGLWPDGG